MEQPNNDKLKKSAFGGIIWKVAERICAQLVSLVVSIVLARILTPEDYAPISIVFIFFAFCRVFVSGGINTSLIQKKHVDDLDYSTVLIVNLAMATVLYVVLFVFAPMIASLYKKPIVTNVLRIMALTFFINAFKAVLSAYTSTNLQFRKFFLSTIGGTVFSAVVGITMALKGFGVWALVAQEMSNSFLDTCILFFTTKLRINWRFSWQRMKEHLEYGWNIMISSIISAIYDQLNPMIVGIRFAPVDLSFYNKGNSFPNLINSTVSDTLSSVLFPVMSKVQENPEDVLNITRRYVKTASYVIFPVMVGLFAVSDTFVKVVLTEKWLPAAPYIRIFCFSYMFNLIHIGNLQAIKALGRSDLVLIMEIIKKSLYFVVIAVFVFFSHSAVMLALSSVVCTVIALVVNTYPNRKLICYRYRYQLMDFLPNMLIAMAMGIPVMLMGNVRMDGFFLLVMQVLMGIIIYVGLSLITKNENFLYLIQLIRQILKRE